MGLSDILQRYVGDGPVANSDSAHEHFDEVARTTPPALLGQGLADAFRADSTPPKW
jgi:hypothetical protein